MFAMKELAALCKKIDNGTLVEVVRCGKCMHRDEITGWCDDVQDYISNTNWFCAGGERKDGADDDQRRQVFPQRDG